MTMSQPDKQFAVKKTQGGNLATREKLYMHLKK